MACRTSEGTGIQPVTLRDRVVGVEVCLTAVLCCCDEGVIVVVVGAVDNGDD